jgi:hypothetical protein
VLRRTLVLENRLILIRPGPRTATPDGKVRSFDADARGHEPLAPHTLGLRTVALDRIVGSVDRASELRTNFLPYFAREGDSRYLQIREAMEGGESLPAIELYKLGREYYVLDGHHRVAAALSLGQAEIDASVTEYVPMQDSAACRVFGERRAFERATGLTRIGASRPGHYPRLQALIVAYAEAAGIADPHRAAARWHVEVFQPLAARLRSAQLGGIFPGERTADLLVHLAEFRATEEEFLGRSIPWDDALDMWLKRLRGGQRRLGARLPHLRRTDATEG